jgi:predicted MPP superfamily phosphohydrolase
MSSGLHPIDGGFFEPMTSTVDGAGPFVTPAPVEPVQSRTTLNLGRIVRFVATIQSILFLAHWFVYQTWAAFRTEHSSSGITKLQVMVFLLSVSFVAATLLAHRYSNSLVRLFYKMAATWLGIFNFLFVAACLCWLVYVSGRLFGLHLSRPLVVNVMFGLAILASIYGVINARAIHVNKITVKLPGLPASWRGRVAALVSDVHLGPVNGAGFMRRIVDLLGRLHPDAVFISGDLYDGTKFDLDELAAPWKSFSAEVATYFVTGNHEEFSDPTEYLNAVSGAGIRVLSNEKVVLDGLQIVGVYDKDSANSDRYRSILERVGVDRRRASILLSHVPHQLSIAEEAGISLQLSGHTHGGQIFPFTWFTARIFGEYTYGLKRFGELLVYTSSGTGTWGPPMRVGTRPEIVLIKFE